MGGIEALPVNYALKDIVEVLPLAEDIPTFPPTTPVLAYRPFPGKCPPPLFPFLRGQVEVTCPRPITDSTPLCDDHNRLLEYYCETDKQLVCADCLVMPQHKGHDTVAAREIVGRELESLRQNSFEDAERMLLKVREAVDNVSHMTYCLKEKEEKTKSRIQKHFKDIRDALEAREQSLLNTTEEIIVKKVAKLDRQKAVLVKCRDDLEAKVSVCARSGLLRELSVCARSGLLRELSAEQGNSIASL